MTCDSQQQHQQLAQLVTRVENALEPPIAAIQAALQKYICAKALPAIKPSPSVQDKCTVGLAFRAFGVIGACSTHLQRNIAELDAYFLNAWPGIWRWLQFLDDQCCQRDRYGFKIQTLILIPSMVSSMSISDALRRDMTSTPGVTAMVAGYWKDQGRYPDIEKVFTAAEFSSPFTIALNALLNPVVTVVRARDATPNCLLELITTLGSAEVVATHCIAHLNTVLAIKPHKFTTISVHISLINHLSFGAAPKILLALLDQGMIPLVVKVLLWLVKQQSSSPEDDPVIWKCVEGCILTLMNAMLASNGPSWVSQALDAGILPAMLKSAPRLAQANKHDSTRTSWLLSDILCQYLVYKSVVRSAAKALRRVQRLKLDGGSGGPIWEAWAIFKKLLLERIALKERSEPAISSRTICARLNCNAPIDHEELLRCSGCLQSFYCNKACQRTDWPFHKSGCQGLQRLLKDGIHVPMSSTDSDFIAEIVKNDIYQNGKCSKMLLIALRASPNQRTPSEFIFSLDYTASPVNIKVIPVVELSKLMGGEEFWDPVWNSSIEEALQSDGKTMVVRTQVQRGGRPACSIYMMRPPLER